MKKFLVGISVAMVSVFGASSSFASEPVELHDDKNVVLETLADAGDVVSDFLLPSADASFMGDIAEDIGSGATTEVGVVIGWPIGSIIFYVLAIFLISFIVGTIVMWIGKKRSSRM